MGAARDVYEVFNLVGVRARDLNRAIIRSGLEAEMIRTAREVKEYWQSIAPVWGDKPPKRGEPNIGEAGDYRESIQIMPTLMTEVGLPVIKVGSNDEKAHWLEYGSIHNPEHGYGQRVMDHFAGEVTNG